MTPKEAIKILEVAKAEVEWNYPLDYAIAIATAIEALEKQIPKKPISLGEDIDRDVGQCPNCKEIIDTYEDYKYCSDCGQAIYWSGEE